MTATAQDVRESGAATNTDARDVSPGEPHVDQPGRFAYRPAIDGLRAIAVLGVLLYHGAQLTGDPLDLAPGGFLGVDLFMVLSGYLITTLLLLEWQSSHSIRLGRFYVRRARRLLPALLAVLAAVSIAFLLGDATGLDGGQAARFAGDALSSLFYVANWRFALSGASYFDQFGDPSPLRHMWSLAIEEQFYLIWPLLLLGMLRVLRLSRQMIGIVIMVGIWASALLMALLFDPESDPSRVYYGTDTRAQALLVGAFLAVVLVDVRSARLATPRVQFAGAVGLVGCLVLFATAADDSVLLYQGGFLAVAVLSALAITAAAAGDARSGSPSPYVKVLSVKPLVWLGTISYGLYLWHWPVYVVLDSDRTGLTGLALLVVRMVVAITLAVISYRLIEAPLRFGALERPKPRVVALSAGVVAAAVLVAAVLTVQPERNAVEALGADELEALEEDVSGVAQPGDTRVLLVGDSVALTLGLYRGATPGLWVKTSAILGCGVARGTRVHADGSPAARERPECERWPAEWQDAVARYDPDVSVLLIGAWEVFDREVDGQRLQVGSEDHARYLERELEEGHRILTQGGRSLVLLTAACFAGTEQQSGSDWPERRDPTRVAQVNAVLAKFAATHERVTLVDLYGYVCPGGEPVGEIDGATLFRDGVHYTPEGAPKVWAWLAPQLRPFGEAR